MVRASGLTKQYGRIRALDGVTFMLAPGEIVALLGPNGAGKTTTFKCLLGVTNFQGSVEVNGIRVRDDGKAARRRIGYLPQTTAFDDKDTCQEVLRFLAEIKGARPERAGELLERVRLSDQRRTRVGHLSGGMRQRLALAAALLSDPPVLLLDEPTANLDAAGRGEFHDLLLELRAEDRTIVLSTHFVENLGEITDRVIVLKHGRVELDAVVDDLRQATRGHRFMVNLNGTEPAAMLDALSGIGIAPERVTPLNTQFEELLANALHEEEEAK